MRAPFGGRVAPPLGRAAKASRWLLAATVLGSALAVGTVHTITLCIVTGALAMAVVLGWWGAEPTRVRPVATLLVGTGLALTAYTALECVPMPAAWLGVLAPHNADVWSRALSPLREPGPSWAPISLDPTSTRVEVLKGVAYLLALLAALRIARKREGVSFLATTVVATGAILAVAALLHPALGATKLYGVYEPGWIGERHIAPLLNANNLSGYLTVSLCLALGATLSPEPRVPRPIMGAITLLLAATQVWVASRAGVVTMMLGAVIVGAIVYVTRTRGGAGAVRTVSFVSGAVSLLGAALIALGGSEEAANELLDSDLSKLAMFQHVMRMLPAVPVFGCGRGAFESAYAAYRVDPGYGTWAYPENFIAQWVLEWGLPVGIAGLGALAFALRPRAALARSTTAAGAWAGMVALAVQNLSDLGTEVPGLMLAGVVCAAIVVGGTPGEQTAWRGERWASYSRAVPVLGAVLAALGIGAASLGISGQLHADQRALHDAALTRRDSADAVHGLVRSAMLRHPAEPYLPFATALRAHYVRDESSLPWLGATLERASVYGPAHLVLARTVAARSPSQARFEFRLALEQASELLSLVTTEAPSVIGGYDAANEVLPAGKLGLAAWEGMVGALRLRLPSTRARIDADVLRVTPGAIEPALRVARDAVSQLDRNDEAPWCDGAAHEGCVRDAQDQVARALAMAPDRCEPHELRAVVRLASTNPAGALRDLELASDAVRDRVLCLQQLAGLAVSVGDETYLRRALDKVAEAGCAVEAECAQNLVWVGQEERARGNPRRALAMFERAYGKQPDNDALLETIAGLASQLALHAQSAQYFDQLARRRPAQPQWKRAADVERELAVRAVMKL